MFTRESDLCAAFIAAIGDWTAYAETAGWDVLLVREDGFQIGVQAKLRLNTVVVAQALEERWYVDRRGPDCRAVLVPDDGVVAGMVTICSHLGITVITMGRRGFSPQLPSGRSWTDKQWHEFCPTQRCRLPAYVPEHQLAGRAAPLQLTDWKIKAIKLAIILERTGSVSRQDFKHLGLDHRRWVTPGAEWLQVEAGAYIAGPRIPKFKSQHPKVYAKIESEYEQWRPRWSSALSTAKPEKSSTPTFL